MHTAAGIPCSSDLDLCEPVTERRQSAMPYACPEKHPIQLLKSRSAPQINILCMGLLMIGCEYGVTVLAASRQRADWLQVGSELIGCKYSVSGGVHGLKTGRTCTR